MHHIYCFSGLGADHRLFDNLQIDNAILHPIYWELPDQTDTMRSYAFKLANQIKHRHIILLGVSFGGMLVSEIVANQEHFKSKFTIEKSFVISSCKTHRELPKLMRLAGKLRVHRLAPYHSILRNHRMNRIAFSLESKEEELVVKRQMLENSNIEYIKRSINIILSWKSLSAPEEITHIHGTKDRLLRPSTVKCSHWITNGGHFMVWNRAEEISIIINKTLSS
jgi:hypothetical protein